MPQWTGTFQGAGLYADIPESDYHADVVPERSLSVSGAKLLLAPSVPAKYKYARDHGRLPTKAQKLGTLAHAMTLGQPTGHYEVLDFAAWNAAGCKKAKEEAIEAGKEPVLRKEWDEARAISDAVLAHPVAGGLLAGADTEVSMFWRDAEFGIWLRGRMDAVQHEAFGFPGVVDLKTSKDASPDGFAKSVHEWGYFRQDPWYREGLAAALGCKWDEVSFTFIVVESDPPHLVATYHVSDGGPGRDGLPTPDDVSLGREHNKIAREIYAACDQAGTWPGYDEDIKSLALRHFDRKETEKAIQEWHD